MISVSCLTAESIPTCDSRKSFWVNSDNFSLLSAEHSVFTKSVRNLLSHINLCGTEECFGVVPLLF